MPITGLVVTLDRATYSRYELAMSVVTASIVVSGGSESDQITISLKRRRLSGWSTLQASIHTLTAGEATAGLFVTTFDLDALAAPLSRRPQDYQVEATANLITGSARFSVALMSPETFRNRWLTGLPLLTAERKQVRMQPQLVTGVVVEDVSAGTALGIGSLTLTVTAGPVKTLTWRTGTPVTLDLTSPARYALRDAGGVEYLVVRVTPSALPVASVSESLLIDYARISDDALTAQLIETVRTVESGIHCFLDYTVMTTQLLVDRGLVTEYDVIGPAVEFVRPYAWDRWFTIGLPVRNVVSVETIEGWFNQVRTVSVPPDWITVSPKNGLVSLVPSGSSAVNWVFYGPGFYSLFSVYPMIPQFWQYAVTAGLGGVPEDIAGFVARRAAIPILAIAGNARYAAGVTSYSLSRDGVSEGRSLIPGVYLQLAQQYQLETGLSPDGRDLGMDRMRAYYAGPEMVML